MLVAIGLFNFYDEQIGVPNEDAIMQLSKTICHCHIYDEI